MNAGSHIHLCFSPQRSDHWHRFGRPSQFDLLPGDVFPGCVVPQRPRHPPQESHEEVPGERRGENFIDSSCDSSLLCQLGVFEKKKKLFFFF